MSCRHGEETFPCNQSSKYCLGCRIKKNKFPLIEEEEITTKDGTQIKKTKRTKTTITKDGVLALTTTTTKKDGVLTQTTTTTTKDGVLTQTTTTTRTKDGVPEKTTTTTRKYGVPAKTTTTNDEAPTTTTNDEAPEDEVQAKTATKEQ